MNTAPQEGLNPGEESGNSLIDDLADWLMVQALTDSATEDIYEGTCKRIFAAGIPLSRGMVTFFTLHPLFDSQSLVWLRNSDLSVEVSHHRRPGDAWVQSPLYFLTSNNLRSLRRSLKGEDAMLDFPILKELQEAGATDYLAFCVNFSDNQYANLPDCLVGSWSTHRPTGFSEREIRALNRIEQRLSVVLKIGIKTQISKNILAAYLGPVAGARVLGGQIKRGDGEMIHAVIWYSDLRGSTRLAASLSSEEFLKALNRYFECTAGAVVEHGGQALRFIGDAVLAIFPASRNKRDTKRACAKAMAAAKTAQEKLKESNLKHKPVLDFGLGLHVGEVLFGNIGIPERVEFSVVGPAANEVARIESLTKTLKKRVLVSKAFADHLSIEWVDMGPQALKGVGQKISVYHPAHL